MKASNRVRFGRIVRERREALGMTQDDVTAAGGPSDTTQTRIERAEGSEPTATTRNRFDHALRWEPGSAARVWAGGHPAPLPEPPVRPASPAPAFELGPMEVPVSLEQLTELLEILNSLTVLAEEDDGNHRLASTTEALQRFVSSLTGTWVTDILERNRSSKNGIPTMIEFAFSAHLAEPVDPEEPSAEERYYRRWLIGRANGIPEELAARFEERFASRRGGIDS
ncbi:helix-turn-helix domain-containing protein [Rhodococcus sp. PD04]|uniref:helix-turn-helix domain-containing protein n=1 Tax=Rhodococcus sp. PD04 TaxID=3109594 RepID=UPI002DD82AA3|nr:helix-turn-helix domain-containing protein [Rhodococcus sp. PD04]WSE25749.1 helix-turn-helix domain-containing protein [Rhodococcus sp. PD04]